VTDIFVLNCVKDEVRSQDSIFVMASVARSKEGRKLAWAFCKSNFSMLYDRYKVSQHYTFDGNFVLRSQNEGILLALVISS